MPLNTPGHSDLVHSPSLIWLFALFEPKPPAFCRKAPVNPAAGCIKSPLIEVGAVLRKEQGRRIRPIPASVSHQAPEIHLPARDVEGILACRGLVAPLLCLALSSGWQEEAATEAKERLPGSLARLTEPSAEEAHTASPPLAELVACVREEVRSLLHQASRDATKNSSTSRGFTHLCRNLASSRPSCCRISGLRAPLSPENCPSMLRCPGAATGDPRDFCMQSQRGTTGCFSATGCHRPTHCR